MLLSEIWPLKRNVVALSCVATSVLRMRLMQVVAFSKKLRWLAQTKVLTLKTQLHAVNTRWKRLPQLNFKQVTEIYSLPGSVSLSCKFFKDPLSFLDWHQTENIFIFFWKCCGAGLPHWALWCHCWSFLSFHCFGNLNENKYFYQNSN